MDQWGGCLSSGLDINSKMDIVSVYPNPAKDFITLKISKNSPENYSFVLMDVTGKIVTRAEVLSNYKIAIPGFVKNGLYFYTIYGDAGFLSTGKIVIQKD